MPKVIHTRPLFGTLDNMTWEQLEPTEEHEHRYLSPELTDEQADHYLALNGFHAQTVEQKPVPDDSNNAGSLLPEGTENNPVITADNPPVINTEIPPVIDTETNPAAAAAGSDVKIQKAAGAKSAKNKSPARETPAERKARLAKESNKGAE